MTLEQIRKAYAEGLGVRSPALRRALTETPRERFLGPGPWTIVGSTLPKGGLTPDDDPAHVYQDVSVALDAGRHLYNGAPGTVMSWLDALDLREGERVFHVGGATGYYTALMARAVGPGGHVLMAEVDATLGKRAQEALADLGNVEVVVEDGTAVDPGPFDAILVHAGVTHPALQWVAGLNDGGRMLLPLTFGFPNSNLGKGAVMKVTRHGARFAAQFVPGVLPVVIYSCTSVRDADLNQQLFERFTTRVWEMGAVQSLRVDRHEADATCWAHAETTCWSKASP